MGTHSEIYQQSNTSVEELMKYVFYPNSVAVIGASRDSDREMQSGWVGRLVRFGYEGKIYPINPKASEIMNLKAYPSVSAIPEAVDYVIVTVPRELVPNQIRECVRKNVKVVHVYTAGFSETGSEEGKKLQEEVLAVLKTGNIRLIGPNCMGVYCPASKLTFDVRFPRESGSITFISQTGVGGRRLIYLAAGRGLRFNKAISYGNAIDLNVTDFLEYAISDPETRYILLYLEGLQDGQRFFHLLRQYTGVKPVVMLKGGLSESGAGAAASHTASLAGSHQVWQALFKQANVIPVDTLEEAVEQILALQDFAPMRGRRVGLVGRGGGIGVVATDMCEREGLKVPQFSAETRKRLAEITPAEAGSSVRNPVEIGLGVTGVSEYYIRGIESVALDPNIDMIVTFLNPEDYLHYGIKGWIEDISNSLIEVGRKLRKPFAVVILPGHDIQVFEATLRIQQKCQEAGIACFPTLDAAIKAIGKLVTYYELNVAKFL